MCCRDQVELVCSDSEIIIVEANLVSEKVGSLEQQDFPVSLELESNNGKVVRIHFLYMLVNNNCVTDGCQKFCNEPIVCVLFFLCCQRYISHTTFTVILSF